MVPTLRAVSSLGDVLHCSKADVDNPYTVMIILCSSDKHNCEESRPREQAFKTKASIYSGLQRPHAAATSIEIETALISRSCQALTLDHIKSISGILVCTVEVSQI